MRAKLFIFCRISVEHASLNSVRNQFAIATHPNQLAIGIDEETALIVHGESRPTAHSPMR